MVVVVLDPGDVVVDDGDIVVDGDMVVVEDDGAVVVVVVDESLGTGTGTATTVDGDGVDTTGAGVLMTVGFSHAVIAPIASEAANNTEYFIFNSPVIKKWRTERGSFRT